MRKRVSNKYYRSPKTTQEKRANQDREYVRGARLGRNLPSVWDDKPILHSKSWKSKRKTQYRGPKRGRPKYAFFKSYEYRALWDFTEYLEDNNIPYREEHIYVDKIYRMPDIYGNMVPKKGKALAGHKVTYWTNKRIEL